MSKLSDNTIKLFYVVVYACVFQNVLLYYQSFIEKILWDALRRVEEVINVVVVHMCMSSNHIGTSIKTIYAKSGVLTRTMKPIELFEPYSHANCINTSRKRPANCFTIDFSPLHHY